MLESHHDSDSNGDRLRDSRDVDDRPWFQLMKRKRSVTETVKRDRDIDNLSYHRYENADRSSDINIYEEQQDSKQRQHSMQSATMHSLKGPTLSNTNTASSSPKPYSGFRSGLAILLDVEK